MNMKAFLTAMVLGVGTLASSAAVGQHSKTIAVESPDALRVLAYKNPAAMYLYDTNDGRTLLYVEAKDGRALTTLDVSDPSDIRRIAQTNISAPSAFDFVQDIGEQAALIRYRDGSGIALLSFKHYKRPTLMAAQAFEKGAVSKPLGATGLLLTSLPAGNQDASRPLPEPRNFKVMDATNPVQPVLLATINGVLQMRSKDDSGTLFFLNRDGITVVRRLRVEQEHQADLNMENGN
ncbi:MAG: hypothetical protein WCE63_16680 [Acidobacteriaceae bacterium]